MTWTLYHADNLDPVEGMARLEDLSVDHYIGDPPYSENVHRLSRRGLTDYKERKGAGARDRRTRDLGFDHLTPEVRAAMAMQIKRVTRRWALVYCDLEGFPGWKVDLEAAGMEYVRCGIWHKLGSTPQLTGDRPGNAVEAVVIAHQTKPNGKPMRKRWNGRGKHAWWDQPEETVVWEHPIVLDRGHDGLRVHTTQKPLSLLLEQVEQFTDPGDLICDPYVGSGTTGVACNQLGRDFVGWESDTKHGYYEIARRRLSGLRAKEDPNQVEMFG